MKDLAEAVARSRRVTRIMARVAGVFFIAAGVLYWIGGRLRLAIYLVLIGVLVILVLGLRRSSPTA
ncbi:MAG TPA: hypothetical protein VF722_01840 [Gemmatimonadaceae bacterium]|jgi:hypothetical protein